MMADKEIEQLRVEPVGVLNNIVHLEPWLDVEVIANMTGLEIEIQQANSPTACLLVELDLNGGFDGKRGVADAATGRHEGCHRRSNLLIAAGCDRGVAGTRNNIKNFRRSALHRDPVGACGADQSLVIAGRNFSADENEENTGMFLLRKVDDAVERVGSQHGKDDVALLVVAGRATLAELAGDFVEPCDLAQIRQ